MWITVGGKNKAVRENKHGDLVYRTSTGKERVVNGKKIHKGRKPKITRSKRRKSTKRSRRRKGKKSRRKSKKKSRRRKSKKKSRRRKGRKSKKSRRKSKKKSRRRKSKKSRRKSKKKSRRRKSKKSRRKSRRKSKRKSNKKKSRKPKKKRRKAPFKSIRVTKIDVKTNKKTYKGPKRGIWATLSPTLIYISTTDGRAYWTGNKKQKPTFNDKLQQMKRASYTIKFHSASDYRKAKAVFGRK